MFWRPRPEFNPGMLVICTDGRCLLIKTRRWARRDGVREKQWVYDGALLHVAHPSVIKVRGYTSRILESEIDRIVVD